MDIRILVSNKLVERARKLPEQRHAVKDYYPIPCGFVQRVKFSKGAERQPRKGVVPAAAHPPTPELRGWLRGLRAPPRGPLFLGMFPNAQLASGRALPRCPHFFRALARFDPDQGHSGDGLCIRGTSVIENVCDFSFGFRPRPPPRFDRFSKEAVMSEVETTGILLAIAVIVMMVWARYKLT